MYENDTGYSVCHESFFLRGRMIFVMSTTNLKGGLGLGVSSAIGNGSPT